MLVFKPVLSRKFKIIFVSSFFLVLGSEVPGKTHQGMSQTYTLLKPFAQYPTQSSWTVTGYPFALRQSESQSIAASDLEQENRIASNHLSLIELPINTSNTGQGVKKSRTKQQDQKALMSSLKPVLIALPTSFEDHPLKVFESAIYAQSSLEGSALPPDFQSINDAAMASLDVSYQDPPTAIAAKTSLEDLAYHEKIITYADKYDIPHSIFAAIIDQESSFNPLAKSASNAIGLGQVMPDTALWLITGKPGPFSEEQHRNIEKKLLDPDFNLLLSARFFAYLMHENNSNLDLALASYNSGLGAVRRHAGIPPFPQTRNYVKKVKAKAWSYFQLISTKTEETPSMDSSTNHSAHNLQLSSLQDQNMGMKE